MLIGLVSHIGAIPILNYASEDPSVSSNKHVVDNALRNLSCITSGLVLTQWGFDPDAVHICEDCGSSPPSEEESEISYRDVLLAALIISKGSYPEITSEPCEFENHPLQRKFSQQGIISSSASFLHDAKEELEKTNQLLK